MADKKRPSRKKLTTADYIANLFSVDEKRVSTLVLILFVVLGIVLFKTNLVDIPPGWASIISALIYGISGVNAVGMGIGYFSGYQDPALTQIQQTTNHEEGDN